MQDAIANSGRWKGIPSLNKLQIEAEKSGNMLEAIRNAGGTISRDTIMNLPRGYGLGLTGAAGVGLRLPPDYYLRSAVRGSRFTTNGTNNLGFRVGRTLKP